MRLTMLNSLLDVCPHSVSFFGKFLPQVQVAIDTVDTAIFTYREADEDFQNLTNSGSSPLGASVITFGAGLGRIVGLENLSDAYEGHDKLGNGISTSQRVFRGSIGSVQLVGTAFGLKATGSAAYSRYTGSARAAASVSPSAPSGTMSRGAQLRAKYGATFDEYARFRGQRYSPAAARRLADPYTGVGQHFIQQAPINRAIDRVGADSQLGRLLSWYRDSPINVVSGRNMNTGRFYEYHARIHGQPAYGPRTAQGMRLLSGEPWRAANVSPALQPYGRFG